ncbi:pentapeptide repeat-containing protein [Nostoc sp. WHI]|uniref:pentapeptide repeat-containing protein n=1 Tax=Nostoc sp. WHI TaxID=2650611 RepID=UPI0018C68CDD|nr:pentapeptide repeat-containing protein [Nostoc sp. WHI]MBG1266745.1 pentapeptide repeat-containing protein [Nostoc sp. WHI]
MQAGYSSQNFRGHSFKDKNLEGMDFSYADIRSADFSNAILVGANFSYAKAGLQKRRAIFLVLISWVLMGLSGFLSTFAGIFVAALIFQPAKSSEITYQIAGCTVIAILIIFFFVTISQGIQAGLRAVAVTFAGAVAFAGAFAGALSFAGAFAVAQGGAVAFAVAGAFAGAFTVTFVGAFAGAVAGAAAGAVAGAFAVTFAVAVAFAGAVVIAGAVAGAVAVAGAGAGAGARAVVIVIAGAVVLFSIYISWRALKGDPKYTLIHNIAVAFAAIGGTSFYNANLTNADFTQATLKSTDFRKAKLTRTCFSKTKKLDRVRPGTSYLQKAQMRQVLVMGEGQDKNFDREDLRGVNFQGANLVDASFVGTNLSQANLQDADLSRAKLVQAQLDGTDFTGATLTGAYIQDWGITTDTKFDGVRCEYVYMRLPTKENPDALRKPDNNKEVFADGEFGDFIQPIFDTLDLYHNQGVDPRAIAISFKQLAENHPDADLEIVATEKRGADFLLRVKTALEVNKSLLSEEYFELYNQLKALTEQELQKLIAEKDSRIRSLENLVETALQRPSFYAESYQNQGGTNMAGERNINRIGGNYNEQIQGNYIHGNYYSAAEKQNLAESAAEIQQLLYQLSLTNPTTNEAVTEVIYQEIRRNPTLKARLQSALKAGGLEALKAIFNHPLFSIPAETIKGWLEAE